ncbi:hypothetical protein SAMD00019534_081800 [Acytostelium subglobosum LB1]|uniref:hypothetical protein n=1 Tax=Acytostelium subglobosum LB1 TaxID=1410327 RepID=UPI0006450CA1|nr:hypothetical protein SAMD00019534_081800 [Acytostelium subglobosum LB1]GAM25005.1 hypothetical protein SAMD00019534_081800 [Acytostelium subglobosum LB1]|eukprot:XP_012752094.1 hypothetical protein SAMD00019534_081800 [Acytostelium subglobosum LB1]
MTTATNTKLKFSEHLWDGYDLLCKRTENDLAQSKIILLYFKKRAEVEDKLAKKLDKLSSKMFAVSDQLEASTGNNAWRKVVNCSHNESEHHVALSASIVTKVCGPFSAMIKDMEAKRKKIVNEGARLRNDLKEMLDAHRKSQSKYEKVSKELESTKLELKDARESPDTSVDSITKLEKRKERLEGEQAAADEEYREQIKATNDFQNLYNVEMMPKILNDFEHFIITHIHLTKTYLSNWSKVINDQPPIYAASYDAVRRLVEQVDNQSDVQDFIRKNKMNKILGTPFHYEPYVEGRLTRKSMWNAKNLTSSLFSKSSAGKKDEGSLTTSGGSTATMAPLSPGKPVPRSALLPTASFGVPIEELMARQRDTHPTLEIPQVLHVLAVTITKLKGHVYEGIFRVPGIVSSIKEIRLEMDKGNFDLSHIDDVRTPAALFKQWLRDTPEPLIPSSLYQNCVDTPQDAVNIVKRITNPLHLRVLTYLVHFIQLFCKLEFVAHSKMGSSNMAMIFAPTILRCPSSDPAVMLNNVNLEKAFVENLIQKLPHADKEFLDLPVSMSDAIMEEDVEELVLDDDINIKSDGETDSEPTSPKATGTPVPVFATTTPTPTSTTTTTATTGVTPSSSNRRSGTQLGWVRIKPTN